MIMERKSSVIYSRVVGAGNNQIVTKLSSATCYRRLLLVAGQLIAGRWLLDVASDESLRQ